MFGEGNTASSIGPNRRGVSIGIIVGCLLLVTAALRVSGTVDGLNFFGARLADSTPTFSNAPKDDDQKPPDRSAAGFSVRSAATTRGATPLSLRPAPLALKPAPPAVAPREAPACARPGYAAVLDPANDPIGTALARSLKAPDLYTRIIEMSGEDVNRVMSGDGSSVTGRMKEGILVVARLAIQVKQTVIDQAPMTEVGGTMDLAIVRNNCGTVTVDRHPDVSGKSVNETLDDGIRGLGEIFKEKIVDLVRRTQ